MWFHISKHIWGAGFPSILASLLFWGWYWKESLVGWITFPILHLVTWPDLSFLYLHYILNCPCPHILSLLVLDVCLVVWAIPSFWNSVSLVTIFFSGYGCNTSLFHISETEVQGSLKLITWLPHVLLSAVILYYQSYLIPGYQGQLPWHDSDYSSYLKKLW